MTENLGRDKPVTMDDIARAAGVHSRTVADALKGTGRVAPATREKVLRIAKELNYVPNAAARALATGRTGKVAVVSNRLTDHYYANAVQLLEEQLAKTGHEMVLLPSHREVTDLVNATKSSLVDGVILIGTSRLKEEYLRQTSSSQSCLLIDTSDPDFVDHIKLDLGSAVAEALELMLEAGRKRIAFIANDRTPGDKPGGRHGKYLEVMQKAGREPETIDIRTDISPDERIETLKQHFSAHGFPDAIQCLNDETAIYTYRAITASGRKVPEDVLLCGCDGLPYMEYFDTPLSTISLPMREICALATRLLQKRMATPNLPVQREMQRGTLIVRKSLAG